MWPLELVATPTDSPRNSPAGTFRKFGTDVYGISGTFCAVAFCCANAGAAHSTKAMADTNARQRFIGASSKIRTDETTVWPGTKIAVSIYQTATGAIKLPIHIFPAEP